MKRVKSLIRRCDGCGGGGLKTFESAIPREKAYAIYSECPDCGEPFRKNKLSNKKNWLYESITGQHFDSVREGIKQQDLYDREVALDALEEQSILDLI